MTHTQVPLRYEREFSGEHWLHGTIRLHNDATGEWEEFYITTDHVHASEDESGEPEADVRLMTRANRLLYTLQACLEASTNDEMAWDEACALIERLATMAIREATERSIP